MDDGARKGRLCATFFETPTKNIGPRFGFAYDAFDDGKTAIRGGFVIFYEEALFRRLSPGGLRHAAVYSNFCAFGISGHVAAGLSGRLRRRRAVDESNYVRSSADLHDAIQSETPEGVFRHGPGGRLSGLARRQFLRIGRPQHRNPANSARQAIPLHR